MWSKLARGVSRYLWGVDNDAPDPKGRPPAPAPEGSTWSPRGWAAQAKYEGTSVSARIGGPVDEADLARRKACLPDPK